MNTTNKQIVKILNKIFPDRFEWHQQAEERPIYDKHEENHLWPNFKIDDAFWLAETVGLLNDYFLNHDEDLGYLICELEGKNMCLVAYEKTIPEVICKAIILIYGEKK